MSIKADNGRRVFALEIGGLIYRYHSGAGCDGLLDTITSGINYVDVEGIISVSAFGASIDPSGGIGDYEPITVTLSINKRGASSDPGIVFGRCGARSASFRAKLTESIGRSGELFIYTDKDLTGFTYPRLMHIGAETVKAQSAQSTRITLSGRSVGNTARQAHTIDLEGVVSPELTTEITTFRGRRAKLYYAHQYADGSLSLWQEAW